MLKTVNYHGSIKLFEWHLVDGHLLSGSRIFQSFSVVSKVGQLRPSLNVEARQEVTFAIFLVVAELFSSVR